MSAPHTDLEKQKKDHKAPLLGMRAVVLWAVILGVLLTIFIVVRGNAPADGEGLDEATSAPAEPVEEVGE